MHLAAFHGMFPSLESISEAIPAIPAMPEPLAQPITLGQLAPRRRKQVFRAGLLAIPLAAGLGWALRSRRTALVAGGVATFALGALRWQLARWFTDTPAYDVDARVGAIELRSYPMRIEARAALEACDFEHALDLGFGRLACYLFGANATGEDIAMTTPAITTLRDGAYSMAFVMPPGRPVASLPLPDDPRVELVEAPAYRVAVLPFRGRFTRDNVAVHEERLIEAIVELGLVTRGSIGFAGYDSPATLPFLRRNEVWIEIA